MKTCSRNRGCNTQTGKKTGMQDTHKPNTIEPTSLPTQPKQTQNPQNPKSNTQKIPILNKPRFNAHADAVMKDNPVKTIHLPYKWFTQFTQKRMSRVLSDHFPILLEGGS